MDIFRFNSNNGRGIEAYGSHFTLNAIGHFEEPSHMVLMSFTSGDLVGRHDATLAQLFYVIEGCGWVAGKDDIKRPIQDGEAAFWIKGEAHSSGTNTHMKAIVVESDGLNPQQFMAEKIAF